MYRFAHLISIYFESVSGHTLSFRNPTGYSAGGRILLDCRYVKRFLIREIQALKRKLVLLEDELQRSESKCAVTTADLNDASVRADEITKAIKSLETKNMIDEESECCRHRRFPALFFFCLNGFGKG